MSCVGPSLSCIITCLLYLTTKLNPVQLSECSWHDSCLDPLLSPTTEQGISHIQGRWGPREQDLGKSFTVYRVEVTTLDGRYFSLVRRYSSFHQLYLQCRDHYYVTTAFPPKTLSNSSGKVREGDGEILTTDIVSQVLDSRRQGLELYLQALTTIQPIPEELLEFLDLKDISINQTDQSGNIEALHWDIFTNIKLFCSWFWDSGTTSTYGLQWRWPTVRGWHDHSVNPSGFLWRNIVISGIYFIALTRTLVILYTLCLSKVLVKLVIWSFERIRTTCW